jgi:hypothetical protein
MKLTGAAFGVGAAMLSAEGKPTAAAARADASAAERLQTMYQVRWQAVSTCRCLLASILIPKR